MLLGADGKVRHREPTARGALAGKGTALAPPLAAGR
jgi:hypothetical protein